MALTRENIIEITNGNELAADFVCAFVNYCHLLDDLVDRDKPADDERLVRESLTFIEQLLMNPWVRERQPALWPLIVQGANAWLDSNKGGSDKDVVKGIYHEVVWFTAYLCGGWGHLRKMTQKYRSYDHEEKGKV